MRNLLILSVFCGLCQFLGDVYGQGKKYVVPQITSTDEIVVPQKAETQYNDKLLTGLFLRADQDSCNIRLRFHAYNYAKKELMPEGITVVVNGVEQKANSITDVFIEDVYGEADSYSEWDDVIDKIVALADKALKKSELENKISETESAIAEAEEKDKPALEAKKSGYQTQLDSVLDSLGPVQVEPVGPIPK